jgi:DNA gyrase subunit A
MSQPWINNLPEVDWHGANGSIQISGEPAADRYTEARLAKSTEEGMFVGINKNNVPMKQNFSEDAEWPVVLPAIFPRLMINGCQGIGSTIANVWLPSNLNELIAVIKEYVETKKLNYSNLAPDFPTGGVIINKDNLKSIYETGKGKVILRAKAEIQKDKILITEVPYQVYIEPLIEEIKKLAIEDTIPGIINVTNKSDKKQLLIEIECEGNIHKILNALYKNTDLQKSFNANQYALVGKTPKLLNLKEYLDIYIEHNINCILKEYSFDYNKMLNRKEIVDGLLKALEDIDNIIALIKKSNSSSDAVIKLKQQYNFTEKQAKAIVDMKLGRLAHLESIELNEEKAELEQKITNALKVINNVQERESIFLTRLITFGKKYGRSRRTELTQIAEPKDEDKEIANIEPEKCVVILSESGLIKRIPISAFRTQRRNTKGVKTKDDITNMVLRTNTVDKLMVFTNKGNMYRLIVNEIPEGNNTSKGMPVNALIEMETGEYPVTIYSIYRDTNAKYVMFVTRNGITKKTSLEEYTKTRKKTGLAAINLKEGDNIASAFLVNDEDVIILTKKGMALRLNSLTIPASGRTTIGLKGITLKDDDQVVKALPIRDKNDDLAIFTYEGMGKRTNTSELMVQSRGGKGLIICKLNDNDYVRDAAIVNNSDTLLAIGNNNSLCIKAEEIPQVGRMAQGNIIIKDNRILSVSKI